jgi:hypothetical protein
MLKFALDQLIKFGVIIIKASRRLLNKLDSALSDTLSSQPQTKDNKLSVLINEVTAIF